MKNLSLTVIASFLATSFLVPQIHAQTSSGTSKAQRLEWPRTFTGQPDFAFTREEAVSEARTRANRENEPLPLAPSLAQLINDDTVLDPLRQSAASISAAAEAEAADVSGTEVPTGAPVVTGGQTLMERLMAQSLDLPIVSSTTKPDLTEFRNQLSATISGTIANWQPQAGRYNFEGVLNGLVLQAIVTSPVKYAVINQQRYVEGETFRITVPLAVPDAEIDAALLARMPAEGTLPAPLMESYQAAYKEALTGFAAARNKTPTVGQQTLVLPVRITGITPRQVLLDVNGQPYALTIRYAY